MSMIQETTVPLFEEVVNGFNRLSAEIPGRESSDLRRVRQTAFEKFRLLGFPTIRNEDWKYTNINRFLKDEYTLAEAGNGLGEGRKGSVGDGSNDVGSDYVGSNDVVIEAAVAAATIPALDCYQVVLVNGSWSGDVKGGPLPKGIELLTVAAARQDPALSAYFEKADWNNHHFATLNTAIFTDGLFIRVDAGAVSDKPLQIVHVFTAEQNLFVAPRHVWVINRNAELSVIETIVSGEGPAKVWVNSLSEIIVHADARVDHTVIQSAAAGVRQIHHTTVRQKKQSLYNNYTFTLPGADLVRNDLQARLEEDHTETHLYGLYLAAGQQLIDNHTLVDHQKPSCFSNELYKGVLLEQSTGVFNGKVFVHRDAQKTNAFQQNNNLVISKKATIDSKPELEIFADDVKCSHGSTVGQFSEDALFYLRARGIGEETAKALLINAFAFDVTEKIKFPAVEHYINELISHHIPVANG
jgi:Fe-S cluster assembly protein SufD